MRLSQLKPNPNNPRFIVDEKFSKLAKSIKDFPEMMKLRPIIVDSNHMILGGNMRYRALLEAGIEDIPDEWVKMADNLTDHEKKQFVIKDNLDFGSWDREKLANEWEPEMLTDWGFEEAELIDSDFGGSDGGGEGGGEPKPQMVKCPCCSEVFELDKKDYV